MYDAIVTLSQLFVKLSNYEEQTAAQSPSAIQQQEQNNLSFEEFKKLDDPVEIVQWAERNLQKVKNTSRHGLEGIGTGRLVYDLGDKVLKVAHNRSGIAQNFNEARIQDASKFFTKVFDMHPKALWIISDKIHGLKPGEFERITGIPESITAHHEDRELIGRITPDNLELLKNRFNLNDRAVSFLHEIAKARGAFDIIMGDIFDPTHWGWNDKGELKVFDYGLNKSTYDQLYNPETGGVREEHQGVAGMR